MQDAVRNADYHPLELIDTFPTACPTKTKENGDYITVASGRCTYPLARVYNRSLTGELSLANIMESNIVVGGHRASRHYNQQTGSRSDSYDISKTHVYAHLLTPDERGQANDWSKLYKNCAGYSIHGHVETRRGGASVHGSNGQNCLTIKPALMQAHDQGFRLTVGNDTGNKKWNVGALLHDAFVKPLKQVGADAASIVRIKTGVSGKILDTNEYCNSIGQYLDMQFDKKTETLSLSCDPRPLAVVNHNGKTNYYRVEEQSTGHHNHSHTTPPATSSSASLTSREANILSLSQRYKTVSVQALREKDQECQERAEKFDIIKSSEVSVSHNGAGHAYPDCRHRYE